MNALALRLAAIAVALMPHGFGSPRPREHAQCAVIPAIAIHMIDHGVRIHVDPDVAPDLVAKLRAAARCPFDLPGVEVSLAPERDAIDLTSASAEIVDALRRLAIDRFGR